MRTLRFDDSPVGKTRFEILFHGLIILGNQNTQKGLAVLRREISLLDKLEGISKLCECGKKIGDEPDRELDFSKDTPEIKIDDHEFDLLYDYVSRVPWSIGKSGRDAVQTLEWLKNSNDHKTN